jgi:hypothetical protein
MSGGFVLMKETATLHSTYHVLPVPSSLPQSTTSRNSTPSLSISQTGTMHHHSLYHSMSQIYVNSLLIDFERETQHFPSAQTERNPPRINTRELTRKSIECTDLICQSIEYFFEDNKRLIGRMVVLAPFEAARSLFSHLCKSGTGDERLNGSLVEKARFCDTVTQRIRESGLPIWDG